MTHRVLTLLDTDAVKRVVALPRSHPVAVDVPERRAVPGLAALVASAVAVFVVVRAVVLAVLLATPGGAGAARLAAWDGARYLHIAQSGYPASLPDSAGWASNIAFFPLYPFLVRLCDPVLPGSALAAAVLISVLAGSVAAALVALVSYRVLRPRTGERRTRATALAVAALWSAQPASFVLSMAYSEALFTALAAGCLLALLTRRWLTAGTLALLAGLTRPAGVVLAACCVVAAVGHFRGSRRGRDWRPVAAIALAPLGLLGYQAWLGARYHQAGAWFTAERRGWNVYTDGGRYVLARAAQYTLHPAGRPVGPVIVAGLLLSLVLLHRLASAHPPAVVTCYAAGLVVLALTTHGAFGSIPRYELPAFPLLLPLAPVLARLPRPAAAALVLLATLAAGVAGLWTTGQRILPP